MRKVFAILLLLLLGFNLTGYRMVIYFRTRTAKEEIRAFLVRRPKQAETSLLSLTPQEMAQLQWQEKGKEFRYKEHLYDVISKEYRSGKWQIRCLQDEKESKLLHVFIKQSGKAANGKQQTLLKFATATFLPPSTLYYPALPPIPLQHHAVETAYLLSAIRSVPVPPPQFG